MLKKHLLSCKDVAHLASDYLDRNSNSLDHNASSTLNWKIRLHLLACSCCRKFVRHLKITRQVIPQLFKTEQEVDAEVVLERVKTQVSAAQKQ